MCNHATLNDGELMEKYRNDDDLNALAEKKKKKNNEIYRHIYRRVQDHGIAEDLTALTWNRMKRAGHYENNGPIIAWAKAIANNLIIDFWNNANNHVPINVLGDNGQPAIVLIDSAPSSIQLVSRKECVQQMLICLEKLTPAQYEYIELFINRDMKDKDIQEQLGLTDGSVSDRKRRALSNLRECMIKHLGDSAARDCLNGYST